MSSTSPVEPDPQRLTSHFIHGLGGDDTICTFATDVPGWGVFVQGGDGNDTIFVGGSSTSHFRTNTADGGPGDDVLHGGPLGDLLIGGDGNDELFAYQGQDVLGGEAGDDVLSGGREFDLMSGGPGDDTAYGGPGDDEIYSGIGRDTLLGGAGNDVLLSNDDFVGFGACDFDFFGEQVPPGPIGIDSTRSFSDDTSGSRLFGGTGTDLLIGSNRWDRMQGGPGDDFMLGMEGRDWMRGGRGDDVLVGGLGRDDLNGNFGADELVIDGLDLGRGGFGIDTCLSADAAVSLPSCENAAAPDDEWADLLGRINAARFDIRTAAQQSLRSVGTCLTADPTLERPLSTVSCDLPHDYEVYRQVLPPADVLSYNESELISYAEDVCSESLDTYLPADASESIRYAPVIPTREQWSGVFTEGADRLITCVLFDSEGGQLVGRAG